jgi:hypothetical protein
VKREALGNNNPDALSRWFKPVIDFVSQRLVVVGGEERRAMAPASRKSESHYW